MRKIDKIFELSLVIAYVEAEQIRYLSLHTYSLIGLGNAIATRSPNDNRKGSTEVEICHAIIATETVDYTSQW
jgi:hypothetical protein